MEKHSMFLVIAWILIVTLTSCHGQFKFNKDKVRTTPDPKAATVKRLGQKSWDGNSPKPPVPGDNFTFSTQKYVKVHGGACKEYINMNRGVYYDKDDPKQAFVYYPWTFYVKDCDISKFLYCSDDKCKCFKGYHWNTNTSDDGTCVAGFHQDCAEFKGYDFRISPICGEGMQCVSNGTGEQKICVCFQNQANYVYRGNVTEDTHDALGNPKYYCARPKPLNFGDPCNEYRGQEWRPDSAAGPGKWKLFNVTKTDCNDGPESTRRPNLYCRFPSNLTGPLVTYGNRTGGICACTDPELDWDPNLKGCYPKPGTNCTQVNKTITVTFKGWDPKRGKDATIKNATFDCGLYGACQRQFYRNGTQMQNGVCVCGTDKAGDVYEQASGFCFNATEKNVGVGRNVGDNCTVAGSDRCHLAGFQECVSGVCDCKKPYGPVDITEEGKPRRVCKGLYGVKCKNLDDCVTDGYECVQIPGLKFINASANEDDQFCVCAGTNFLNTETGKCGAGSLTPTQFGLVLLVLLYLGNFDFLKS